MLPLLDFLQVGMLTRYMDLTCLRFTLEPYLLKQSRREMNVSPLVIVDYSLLLSRNMGTDLRNASVLRVRMSQLEALQVFNVIVELERP